jgi:YVTN family beta-propeller protein
VRTLLVLVLCVTAWLLVIASSTPSAKEAATAEPHRSPTHLVLLPDGKRVVTANHGADSVSLVDIQEGKVLAEVKSGKRPVAVACTADGKRVAVSNLWSASVTLFDVEAATLKKTGELEVGVLPRSLAFAPDGKTLYVALAGEDAVVALDWKNNKVLQRWSAPREPRVLALSPDGKLLAAASTRTAKIFCWNTETGARLWQRKIEDSFDLHGLAFEPNGQWLVCSHEVKRSFPVSKENIDKGWAIDSRLSRLSVEDKPPPNSSQVALDTRGAAVGDPQHLALTPDGATLVVAAGGTHELLLFQAAALPWSPGDPGDFIDPTLEIYDKFHRVPLGGRPLGLAFTRDSKQVIVANHLRDAVQVVDLKTRKLTKTILLGGPTALSAARRGEILFYDAQRSHNQWFSCHTCHTDGHTCGTIFDTLNDESYGNAKLTPTLRNVAQTGPWTWHGWQKDLGAAVKKSFTETMFGPEPKPEEVKDVVAFLETLEHPPRPEAKRGDPKEIAGGKEIFAGKAGCARCHAGPNFTSTKNYDVKLEEDGSPFTLWNPPTLRGLWDRGPFLHDARADSVEEVMDTYHRPEKLGAKELTAEERRLLIVYLRSLD